MFNFQGVTALNSWICYIRPPSFYSTCYMIQFNFNSMFLKTVDVCKLRLTTRNAWNCTKTFVNAAITMVVYQSQLASHPNSESINSRCLVRLVSKCKEEGLPTFLYKTNKANEEPIWMFPKIVVPPNHPFVHRVFHEINHPFWGKKKKTIFGSTSKKTSQKMNGGFTWKSPRNHRENAGTLRMVP